jgi:hypothetical protein
MRSRLLLTSLAACALLAGCRGDSGISFDQFVNATVELRKLSARATTPASYAAGKREVEARLHVTDADLDRWARDHSDDVTLMSAAWDSVEARLGRATEPDTASGHGVPNVPGARPPGTPVPGATVRFPRMSPPPPTTSAAAAPANPHR